MACEGLGGLALPHLASPYKGEETQIYEYFQFPHFHVSDG